MKKKSTFLKIQLLEVQYLFWYNQEQKIIQLDVELVPDNMFQIQSFPINILELSPSVGKKFSLYLESYFFIDYLHLILTNSRMYRKNLQENRSTKNKEKAPEVATSVVQGHSLLPLPAYHSGEAFSISQNSTFLF